MSSVPGYMGKIARVDLSARDVSCLPTEEYSHDFIGGQGMAARIYWDEVPPEVGALDPDNRLVFATGPCAGFPGLAGGRWVVVGKSPATTPNLFAHCNLGGAWGTELKAAGFDGLVVQGRAEKPVYLIIQDGQIEIRDASGLWGTGSVEVRGILKGELGAEFKVVAVGPGGEGMAVMATLQADNDASGSGGLGAVMGSKKLKAVAVKGSGIVRAAHPQRLAALCEHVAELQKDAPSVFSARGEASRIRRDPCAGCTDACLRYVYEARDGRKGKSICQSSGVYVQWAQRYYQDSGEVFFYANRLCDDYGLNTKAVAAMLTWLDRCHKEGLLTEKGTGLPLSKTGSLEFLEALLRSIARREGFGDMLAQGLPQAARTVGSQAEQFLVEDDVAPGGEKLGYVPRAFITTGLLHALDPRQPIQQLHQVSKLVMPWVLWAEGKPGANLTSDVIRAVAKRFWGSETAADFSTYEGKALAAKMIQEHELAKDSLILCDMTWPILYVEHSPDHVGEPSLESQVFSAVTGVETTREQLDGVGERICNLQRAILVRERGFGKEGDTLPEASFTVPLETERENPRCLVPGKDGAITSRKGAVVDRDEFQRLLTEYYQLRGWDPETGLQPPALLEKLRLGDVARDLAPRGLLSPPSVD
ncbi:MAG: hypothetical protein HYY01_08075 [Chloroflexi bacterium]|nr:hypothetical protein [Chloroflexota bacterium]